MTLSICGCFPLVFRAGLRALHSQFLEFAHWDMMRRTQWRGAVITGIIAALTVLSLFLDDIGPMTSIEGAVTVLLILCVCPIAMVWTLGFHVETDTRAQRQAKESYQSVGDEVEMERKKGTDKEKTMPTEDTEHIEQLERLTAVDAEGEVDVRTRVMLGCLLVIGIAFGIAGIAMSVAVIADN